MPASPGHTAYLIASGNDPSMVWDDTVHVPEVQTAIPEAGMAFDTDRLISTEASHNAFDILRSPNEIRLVPQAVIVLR